ncbi:acyl-CoA N-acyltransferase [Stachybotrys elegans]|uniref:N-alpha-acetyltransferase 40 n=1 Tax=Stachybotrys elegans TaxID=80388 RepID=A0A8K0WSS8_9HYPO|nr:acyl-CoA N-acyltransferase [Stachybotrys elegans]
MSDSASPAAAELESATKAKPINHIEIANKKSDEEFVNEYLRPRKGWTQWTHPTTAARYTLSLHRATSLTPEDLDACFHVVFEGSGHDYKASGVGWHPAAKRKEMRHRDLRYVLVKDGAGAVQGFTSMMPTYENYEPVVYCYEIHLRPELQGAGFGKQLLGLITDAAENIPSVVKAMLTCFMSNTNGIGFYTKMGFVRDEFSPPERKLRGKIIAPDYMIMSRRTALGRRMGPGAS